jgi:hypothetical protein
MRNRIDDPVLAGVAATLRAELGRLSLEALGLRPNGAGVNEGAAR